MVFFKMQYPCGIFLRYTSSPAKKATAQAAAATVSRLFSIHPSASAATVPHSAVIQLPVEEKMAGKVIAPSTAYGT